MNTRALALSVLLLAPLGAGCRNICGTANTELNGRVYRVFTNAEDWTLTNEEEFPFNGTPANGYADWALNWGAAASGPVTVLIDGQEFAGNGTYDTEECGNFQLRFEGTYVNEDRGSEHKLAARGDWLFYDKRLEGAIEWAEAWSTDSSNGQFTMSGFARGLMYDVPPAPGGE